MKRRNHADGASEDHLQRRVDYILKILQNVQHWPIPLPALTLALPANRLVSFNLIDKIVLNFGIFIGISPSFYSRPRGYHLFFA